MVNKSEMCAAAYTNECESVLFKLHAVASVQ